MSVCGGGTGAPLARPDHILPIGQVISQGHIPPRLPTVPTAAAALVPTVVAVHYRDHRVAVGRAEPLEVGQSVVRDPLVRGPTLEDGGWLG